MLMETEPALTSPQQRALDSEILAQVKATRAEFHRRLSEERSVGTTASSLTSDRKGFKVVPPSTFQDDGNGRRPHRRHHHHFRHHRSQHTVPMPSSGLVVTRRILETLHTGRLQMMGI